ncbi:hypothetical protein [Halolactibacillus sp. JCM 19043]|uniref:beta-sandwich lipoprotein n=1 Tax=Halolactibacillus sp. JCM 19043 TaxID=1460638 RepID=UPI0007833E2F|nr:hypothetical protein [Halolactibacillus sp. JCM 19043]
MKQRKFILLGMVLLTMLLSACSSAADTVSYNISKDSDEFRVIRRVVFYNSLTDTYIMEMVGNISVDIDRDNVIEVIAKVGPDKYQKHYLGLSDNVTYTVEQLGTSDVSEYDYKLIFKPEKIIPIDFEYKKGEEPMDGVVTE